MPTYNIEVVNLDPSCSNEKYQQDVIVNTCTEYLVRIEPSSTAKGPFNILVNSFLIYDNVSRNDLVVGFFVNLGCESTPTYLMYASTYDLNNKIDTVYYETLNNFRWGVGNGIAPQYTDAEWEIFINRRFSNSDRIVNLTAVSGITNPTNIGQKIKLSYPSGSGNTSAFIIYPSVYGYISDNGLQEYNNPANIQGLKPKNDERETITLSGTQYYVAQITQYQGSENQEQTWRVISKES